MIFPNFSVEGKTFVYTFGLRGLMDNVYRLEFISKYVYNLFHVLSEGGRINLDSAVIFLCQPNSFSFKSFFFFHSRRTAVVRNAPTISRLVIRPLRRRLLHLGR
jgi:hypothetical protein